MKHIIVEELRYRGPVFEAISESEEMAMKKLIAWANEQKIETHMLMGCNFCSLPNLYIEKEVTGNMKEYIFCTYDDESREYHDSYQRYHH